MRRSGRTRTLSTEAWLMMLVAGVIAAALVTATLAGSL